LGNIVIGGVILETYLLGVSSGKSLGVSFKQSLKDYQFNYSLGLKNLLQILF